LREVGLVFALSLAGCLAFIGLGRVIPFVAANLHAFVAVLFLVLPSWALGRHGLALEDYGLNTIGLGRALLLAGACALVTFPAYVLGHHYYQAIFFHRPADFAWSNYSAFPEECQGPAPSRSALSLTCARGEILVRWQGPLTVEARGAGIGLGAQSDGVRTEVTQPGGPGARLRLEGEGGFASIRVPPGGEASISALRSGQPIPAAQIEIGASRLAEEQPVRLGRGWWWLVELLLAQLIAVALPEEVFYRGYVQGRLNIVFPRRRRLLGVEVSVPAIFWTSVLFALGHFLLDLNPMRLAVFFPSLLFGWIREHTKTLGGSIVYHALCNVLVRVIIVHY
jgi:hypothetical protein